MGIGFLVIALPLLGACAVGVVSREVIEAEILGTLHWRGALRAAV